ncbi:hypothetical protein L218DRAFT_986493 [Marasmius fiardii PR-910]|nr:hypothetical protein L218DRAFT_986493 [Marasmius fiardii PR-910]
MKSSNADIYHDSQLEDAMAYSINSCDSDPEETDKDHSSAKCRVLENYTITGALKLSRNATFSTEFLYQQMARNEIDLDPEYQRDIVWTKEKQMMLIHSIFWNFYIPPVIFSVVMRDNGSQRKICIDGKQRLTAIRLFMDGLISFKDQNTGQMLWYRDNPSAACSKTKLLLSEKFKSIFKAKQIVCVEYDELDSTDERDVFQRVQMGVPLTAAEKLQAISTPRSTFVKELRSKYLTKQKLGNPAIPWDRSRSRDFHTLSLFVYYASQWNPAFPASMAAMSTLQTWMHKQKGSRKSRYQMRNKRFRNDIEGSEGSDTEGVESYTAEIPKSLQKKIENTMETVSKLMNDSAYNKSLFTKFTKTRAALSSVDVLGMLLLVFAVSQASKASNDLVTLTQLCEIFRIKLRRNFLDIRMSTNSVRMIQEFCISASVDPEKVILANSKLVTGGSGPKTGIPPASSTTRGKRKASPCDSEEEQGYSRDEATSQRGSRGLYVMVPARQSVKSEAPSLSADGDIGKAKHGPKTKRTKHGK